MAMGGVDIRAINKFLAVSASGCPLRLLGEELVESLESPDSVIGIGTADTSEINRTRISATRPAREPWRKFELYMICWTSLLKNGE